MEIIIRPVSKENIDDFLYFFDEIAFSDNKDWSGCYCYFYHFDRNDEEWEKQTAENNRLSAKKLIYADKMKGYLAYFDGEPIGWCNANGKSEYSKLASNKELSNETNEKICSIVCFIIAPQYRRKGVASEILDQICNDYSKQGYDYAEAYPGKGELTSAQHYHGPLAMYRKAGFLIYKTLNNFDIVRKKL